MMNTADRYGWHEDESPALIQEWLWYRSQREPNRALYHLSTAVRMHGPLDVVVLERSVAELVRRHESLRTIFVAQGGRPRRVVHEPELEPLQPESLSHLPPDEQQQSLARLAREEAMHPFSLERAPLLRLKLIRLALK